MQICQNARYCDTFGDSEWRVGTVGTPAVVACLRLISCYYLGLRRIKYICQNIRFPAESWKVNVLDLILNCFVFRHAL